MYYIGFDIGGSSKKAVLLKDKKTLKSSVADLPKNINGLFDLVSKITKKFILNLNPKKVGGIGFSIPGPIDVKREKVLLGPNIPYLTGQPLLKLLRKRLKSLNIKIEHDINCHLLAEVKFGIAKKYQNVFYLALGTGIGAALLVNGKFIYGEHGSAGEFGHNIIDFEKGIKLEDVAASKYVHRELRLSFTQAKEKAEKGDKKAISVFKLLGKNLGIGLANIINTFNPEVIIIGGGLVKAKKLIQPGVKDGVNKYVISPAAKKTKIIWSKMGRFSGALGAALLFKR